MLLPILQAATAQTVVAQVQSYYQGVQHLAGTFTEVVTRQAFGSTEKSDGKVWAEKPDHVRFDYASKSKDKPKKRSVITDGKTLWIVDPPNLQVTVGTVSGSPLPAAIAFLTGGDLTKDYTISLPSANHLVLVPKQKSTTTKLELVVDPKDGHVVESIVTSSQGDTEDFTFTLSSTADVKTSWFSFDPKNEPTYKVVQMNAPAPTAPAPTTTPAKTP